MFWLNISLPTCGQSAVAQLVEYMYRLGIESLLVRDSPFHGGVAVFYSGARHFICSLVQVPHRKTGNRHDWKIVDWDINHQNKQTNKKHASVMLLITFANSLDPDQDRQNIRPDLDPTVWRSDGIPERFFLKKVDFEKKLADVYADW